MEILHMSLMIRNIFKKVLSNNVAKHFSWAGKKSKERFQDLKLAKIIIRKYFLYNLMLILLNLIF